MDDLYISTVIPTYNRADLLPRAIASALAASSPGDEVLVIDDGSTDNTPDAVTPFRGRIRYVRTANRGVGAARNRGISEAQHDLVAFLDSDDEWMPDKLDLQRALMKARPDVLFCFSEFAKHDDRTGVTRHNLARSSNHDPRPWEEIIGAPITSTSFAPAGKGHRDFQVYIGNLYLAMLADWWLFPGTLLARRGAAGEAFRCSEDIPVCDDWVMAGQLAQAGLGAFLDCETATAHEHNSGQLTDADGLTMATSRIQVLERVWGTDARFLEQNGDRYRTLLREQHLRRVLFLLLRGDAREARAELRRTDSPPGTYQLFASLPGPMAQGLLRVYRYCKKGRTARLSNEAAG